MVQQLTGVLASRIEVSPIYGNLMVVFLCAPGWIRTSDLLINSQMLCLLSYKGIFFKKRAISDRTLHISALPTELLSHSLFHLAREAGLEPATTRLTVEEIPIYGTSCVYLFLERMNGIEPSSSVWRTDALPLCYIRK